MLLQSNHQVDPFSTVRKEISHGCTERSCRLFCYVAFNFHHLLQLNFYIKFPRKMHTAWQIYFSASKSCLQASLQDTHEKFGVLKSSLIRYRSSKSKRLKYSIEDSVPGPVTVLVLCRVTACIAGTFALS